MLKKIPNPFRDISRAFSTEKMMTMIQKQILELGEEVRGKLNFETMDDFLDRSYELCDDVWSYMIMMAFKDQEYLEVISPEDLPEDAPFEVISDFLPDAFVPLDMLPKEIRDRLVADMDSPEESLIRPEAWFN